MKDDSDVRTAKVVKEETGLEFKLDGTKLSITIELAEDLGDSKSGKTKLVGTTHGNRPLVELLPDDIDLPKAILKKDIRLGLNSYHK